MEIIVFAPPHQSNFLPLFATFITLFGILVGAIFTLLKYKLDQANYNKDLFDKRYKIFSTVKDIIVRILTEQNDTPFNMKNEEWEQLSLESYFLFGEETYKFIQDLKLKAVSHQYTPSTKQLNEEWHIFLNDPERLKIVEEERKRRNEINLYFATIFAAEFFVTKFPDLKLDSYNTNHRWLAKLINWL